MILSYSLIAGATGPDGHDWPGTGGSCDQAVHHVVFDDLGRSEQFGVLPAGCDPTSGDAAVSALANVLDCIAHVGIASNRIGDACTTASDFHELRRCEGSGWLRSRHAPSSGTLPAPA